MKLSMYIKLIKLGDLKMKLIKLLICYILLAVSISTFAKGAMAKVTVKLVNEENVAITNTIVKVGVPPIASWSGSNISSHSQWETDQNGICVVNVKCYDVMYFTVMSTDKYYGSSHKMKFKDISSGKWQPWNPTIEIKLKKKINPIPMYVRFVKTKFPKKNMDIGFDLLAADWVAPYGKGKTADFIFKYEGDVIMEKVAGRRFPEPFFNCTFTLSFSNPKDGLQPFYVPIRSSKGSSLRSSQKAPLDDYKNILKRNIFRNKKTSKYDTREDRNYYFRVRTKTDKDGNITNALYGKIYDDIKFGYGEEIHFVYYLNPTSNSRDLEWNRQNLFKGLSRLQQGASAP